MGNLKSKKTKHEKTYDCKCSDNTITCCENPLDVSPGITLQSQMEEAPAEDEQADISEHALSTLCAVNDYRTKHGAPALNLNEKLMEKAQQWAVRMAKNDDLEKCECSDGYGEGIAKLPSGDANQVAKLWYDEMESYNFSNPPLDGTAANFIQMMWKSSTEFGCGMAVSDSGVTYVAARFLPPANVNSEDLKANVLPAQ